MILASSGSHPRTTFWVRCGLVAALAVLCVLLGESAWMRLMTLQAARKRLADRDYSIDVDPLPAVVERLARRWHSGRGHELASLLLDRDGLVWVRAAEVIERHVGMAGYHVVDWEVLRDLRRQLCELDPELALRFHVLTPSHSFGWREGYLAPGDGSASMGEFDWRSYWTARAGKWPSATPRSIAFLRDMIFDWSYPKDETCHEPLELRLRAVDALVAHWDPTVSSAEPPDPATGTIEAVLRSQTLDPELRVRVAQRVLQREQAGTGKTRSLAEWEVILGLAGPTVSTDESVPELMEAPAEAFRALSFVDHPRVTTIQAALQSKPEAAALLEAFGESSAHAKLAGWVVRE